MIHKDIFIVRHAKAAPAGDPESDFERPLRRRGRAAATAIAATFASQGWQPDLILCSPARRTRETLAPLLERFAGTADTSLEAGLYQAAAPALLARLQRVPDGKTAVAIVGHNPGLQQLVLLLTPPSAGETRRKVAEKFPTAGIVHLRFSGLAWKQLMAGSARLLEFVVAGDGEA